MKLLLSLLLATSAARKLTTQEADAGEGGEYCDGFACPALWTAKMDIHTLFGNSRQECCLPTCGFYFQQGICGDGYVRNDEYIKNTVESRESATQVCCDKMCMNQWTCPDNHAAVSPSAAGNSVEECCKPTCDVFECTGPLAPNLAMKSQIGSSNETCCLPACSEYQHCERDAGWVHWDDKNSTAGSTRTECCLPLCSNTLHIPCSDGWLIPKEREDWSNGSSFNRTAGEESPCCKKTCRAHTCGFGWVRNNSLLDEWGDSDEDCCKATCGQFECDSEAGWAADPSKASLLLADVGAEPDACCQKTCKQFQCADEIWLTPSANQSKLKENLTGWSNSTCCSPACSQHTCPLGSGMVLIPDSNRTLGAEDEVCCEPTPCSSFRNDSLKTRQPPEKHCNEIANQTECEKAYYVWKIAMNVTNQNGTKELRHKDSIVSCAYDATYRLCRFEEASHLEGCKGFTVD